MKCSPDIFALGIQEIVPLTAQQIVQTDPEKRFIQFLTIGWTCAENAVGGCGKLRSSIPSNGVRIRKVIISFSEATRQGFSLAQDTSVSDLQIVGRDSASRIGQERVDCCDSQRRGNLS